MNINPGTVIWAESFLAERKIEGVDPNLLAEFATEVRNDFADGLLSEIKGIHKRTVEGTGFIFSPVTGNWTEPVPAGTEQP